MVHVMVDALDSTINVATSEEWHNVYHAIQTVSPSYARGDPLLIGNVADDHFWSLQRKYMLNISIALDEALLFSHRIRVFKVHCSEIHGSQIG